MNRRTATPAVAAVVALVVSALATPVRPAAGDESSRSGATRATSLVAAVQDLGTLGGRSAYAYDIDGDVVVGNAQTAEKAWHAYAYDLGASSPAMVDLGTLGGDASWGAAVDGSRVVGSSTTSTGARHLFVYDLAAPAPAMLDLGGIGSQWSESPVIDGDIVAWEGGESDEPAAMAADLSGSGPRVFPLGGLVRGGGSSVTAVDGNVVVGSAMAKAGDPDSRHAVAWVLEPDGPRIVDLGTLGYGGTATDVDGDLVVGSSYSVEDGAGRGFLYDLGADSPHMVVLGTLGGAGSEAYAVDEGVVVGAAQKADGTQHAFAYDPAVGPGLVDLGSLGLDSEAAHIDGDMVLGTSALVTGGPAPFVVDLGAPGPRMVELQVPDGLESDGWYAAVDGNRVVGTVHHLYERHAVVWTLVSTSSPVVRLARLSTSAAESSRTAVVSVVRDGDPGAPVSVRYTTEQVPRHRARESADYRPVSGTLAFGAGETSKTFEVPLVDDREAEGSEVLAVRLFEASGAVLGTPRIAAVRIRPDDMRPDLWVRPFDDRFVGDDLYEDRGFGQTVRRLERPGRTTVFYVRLQSDALHPLTAGGGPRTGFALRTHETAGPAVRFHYYRRSVDVSDEVRSRKGLLLRPELGLAVEITVRVTVGSHARSGTAALALLRARAVEDTALVDTVRVVLRVGS